MKVVEIITAKQDEYPIFYGIFGEAIKKAASKQEDSGHPLLDVVNKGEETLWEKELQEAMSILGLTSTEEFVKTYKLHPNHIASSEVSFWAFMAEIYILFSLDSLGFKNIQKILERDNMPNPDYMAEFKGEKFVVEIWRRTQGEKAEEYAKINSNGFYNITQLEADTLERIVELYLPKFEKQMEEYKDYKKIAAIYHPGKMLGMFVAEDGLNSIGSRLLQKTEGVNYFLFRFKFQSLKEDTKTFIVPELPKEENSN